MLATYTTPLRVNGVSMAPQQQQLRADLQAIVKKIQSLRDLTAQTGFFTHRDIGDLLRPLTIDDLVAVSDALKLKPREMPRKLEVKK